MQVQNPNARAIILELQLELRTLWSDLREIDQARLAAAAEDIDAIARASLVGCDVWSLSDARQKLAGIRDGLADLDLAHRAHVGGALLRAADRVYGRPCHALKGALL
jgi:hypothetical protein